MFEFDVDFWADDYFSAFEDSCAEFSYTYYPTTFTNLGLVKTGVKTAKAELLKDKDGNTAWVPKSCLNGTQVATWFVDRVLYQLNRTDFDPV